MRAGFFNAGDVAEITDADEIAAQRAIGEIGARAMLDSIERARGGDRHYSLFLALLAAMVGDYRLFDYTDLGLKEPRPDLRRIGTTHPDVVLVAEKRELDQATDLLGERDDISTLIMGGIPSLLSTEYFAKALRTAHVSTITLIAYVDFDPGGWIAISGLVGQLRRYGVHVRHVGYLIRPERFTENEIDLHAYSVSSTDPQIDGKVKAWVAESGGIHGQERGIHADVMPVARVLAAYQEEIRATRKPINGGNI